MTIQIQGVNSGAVADVAGTKYSALKVQQMPTDYRTYGSYRKAMSSGTIGANLGSNSEIYQFYWAEPTRTCVIHKIILDGLSGSATAFAAGFARIYVTVARKWTGIGSGGTAATLGAGNLRSSMAGSKASDIRISSTAALTAGTKTYDTDAIGQYVFSVSTAVSQNYSGSIPLFGEDIGPVPPLVLSFQEGFTVRATVPATGTWQFGITTIWSEVVSY